MQTVAFRPSTQRCLYSKLFLLVFSTLKIIVEGSHFRTKMPALQGTCQDQTQSEGSIEILSSDPSAAPVFTTACYLCIKISGSYA